MSLIVFLFFVPQPVFLADFKQIKKIQCLSQSDGKALMNLEIEGARQVSTTTTVSTYYTILLCTVLRMKIAKINKYIYYREHLQRKFDPVHVLTLSCPFFFFLIASVNQCGHDPSGGEHDGPY